jgi:tetratricopeptide (TPR) repeat protein
MIKRLVIIFMIMIVLLFSIYAMQINNKNKKYNILAKALNNEAMSLYNDPYKTHDFNKILSLFDEAIKIDSTYYLAYENKATLLSRAQRFNEAINCIKKLQKIKKNQPEIKDHAEGYVYLGNIYDKIGKHTKAIKCYKEALSQYNIRFKTKPDLNRAFTKLLLGRKKEAFKEIEELISEEEKKEGPDLKHYINMREFFKTFDKNEFLEDLFKDNSFKYDQLYKK